MKPNSKAIAYKDNGVKFDNKDVPEVVRHILSNRGFSQDEFDIYFDKEPEFNSPLDDFEELGNALGLLDENLQRGFIGICGDYDVDGMTSTALLIRLCEACFHTPIYRIPDRIKDGYGMSVRIVDEFHKNGVSLIITVDNGSAAVEAIAHARALGIDVIVTDHHELGETLPEANVILNPKLIRDDSPYKDLAGVGMAYLLAKEYMDIHPHFTDGLRDDMIALYAMGTVADMVPLTGVNRTWVRQGLKSLAVSQVPGLVSLRRVSGCTEEIDPNDIGFRIGPRINAIGRVGDPSIIVDLLTTNCQREADKFAEAADSANRQRKGMCESIGQESEYYVEQFSFLDRYNFIFAVGEWHPGVIGIVASRLVNKYGVPVFIASEKDGIIKGSARSIEGFSIKEALDFCRPLLESGGGHAMAGGFSLKSEHKKHFHKMLDLYTMLCIPENTRAVQKADVEATLHDMNFDTLSEISSMKPFGIGNAEPLFLLRDIQVVDQRCVGMNNAHVIGKLSHKDFADQIKFVAWGFGEAGNIPSSCDMVVRLKENEYKGDVTIQLDLQSVWSSGEIEKEEYQVLPNGMPKIGKLAGCFDRHGNGYQFQYEYEKSIKCRYAGNTLALNLRNGNCKLNGQKVNVWDDGVYLSLRYLIKCVLLKAEG